MFCAVFLCMRILSRLYHLLFLMFLWAFFIGEAFGTLADFD